MGVTTGSVNRVTDNDFVITDHWTGNQTWGSTALYQVTTVSVTYQGNHFTETIQPMNRDANSTHSSSGGCLVLDLSGSSNQANSEDPVSYWAEDLVDAMAHGVVLPVLLLVCVPTNVINTVVFYRLGLKERINLCVFTLSLVDLLYVLQAFCFYYADRLYTYFTGGTRFGVLIQFTVKYKLVGLFYLNTISFFIHMLIASERCFCVVSPLTSILFMSSTAILVGGLVCGLRWDLICVLDTKTNATTVIRYASKFYYQHPQLVDILTAMVYGIGVPGCCFTVVMATTTVTVIKLKNIASWREESVSSTQFTSARVTKETALTRMLVGNSVLFIVLSVPTVTVRIAMGFVPDLSPTGKYRNLFLVLLSLSIACAYVNSSVNFFVYYSLGTKFRRSVRGMFRNTHNYRSQHVEIS